MEKLLTPQICVTRDLDDATRAEIIRVCIDAFDEHASRLFQQLPPDGLHAMGFLDGELVSHAVRTTRWLQVGEGPLLRTAYIDAVATLGKYRGRGFGSSVMRWLQAEIVREEYPLGGLETGRPGFYARLGWEVWPGPLQGCRDGKLLPAKPEGTDCIMILRTPWTPALDLHDSLIVQYQDGRYW